MAKMSEKKKNIGLRRRVRKTMGAACLITALLVAAIPVPEASAAEEGPKKLTWVEQIGTSSKIPLVPGNCETIYTTDDGRYQFAWVTASAQDTKRIAVILGYNGGTLTGGNLVIPDEVDAYTKFSENEGTGTGYVAVSQSQKPLYYIAETVYVKEIRLETIPNPSPGEDGEPTIQVPVEYDTDEIDLEKSKFLPCYANTRDQWMYVGEGAGRTERPLDEFYYLENGEYKRTENSNEQWIRKITVAYIGNQYLEPNTSGPNADGIQVEWKIADAVRTTYNTDPDNGIFANQGNITNLTVGQNLVGIGNYAFYNCSTLDTITLGNGIEEIGHHAFAECINMKSIGLDFGSNLNYISDYTFYNCRALTSFQLPAGVNKIYDHAFDGCEALTTVDLNGAKDGRNTALQDLGYYVFNGCKALEDLVLPSSLTGTTVNGTANAIHLNNFAGCSNLKRIQVLASALNLVTDATGGLFTVDNFKNSVDPTFYFEADGTANTHTFTQDNAIAFKYAGEDRYEIIIIEKATDRVGGGDSKLTYQVNSRNELLNFDMELPVEVVTIPSTIGPYGVSAINSGSFGGGAGSCYLKKITIPGTVTVIGENAFRGCHNLEHVIFLDASRITTIGKNAFATQLVVGSHQSKCENPDFLEAVGGIVATPKLTFTGAVYDEVTGKLCEPFVYAMNPGSNINQGSQPSTYITYYTGWPTNLEIQYVYDQETKTGAATLIDYPTAAELRTGSKYTTAAYPYMTQEYVEAAQNAFSKDPGSRSDYEKQIVDAALNVKVPMGVKRIATGLFSNATSSITQNEKGEYIYTGEVEIVDESATADTDIQSVTFADIAEFEPYSFTGCTSLTTIRITGGEAVIDDYAFAYEYTDPENEDGSQSALTTVDMTGGGSTIGDYAFCNNKKLTNVKLSSTVSELGLRPFKDCPALTDVDFSGGPHFATDTCIIYGLDAAGNKKVLVECLESRGKGGERGSSTVSATETAGIKEIRPEAFMNCDSVGEVNLSSSNIETVPVRAFADTDNLYSVYLPTTCYSIGDQAFHDSSLQRIGIPRSVSLISLTAFNHKDNPRTDGETRHIDFYTELELPKCAAVVYAENFENIDPTEAPDSREFTVYFWYYDYRAEVEEGEAPPLVLMEQWTVSIGTTIDERLLPTAPDFTEYGYKFVRWTGNLVDISMDTNITAYYEKIDSSESMLKVSYYLDTGDAEPWQIMEVRYGATAPFLMPPADKIPEGHTFVGWSGEQGLENITHDTRFYAKYELGDSTGGNGDGTGGDGTDGDGNGNGNGNGNGQNGTFYTLTVKNGSGSGSYVAGATVIIVANEPASTQEFEKWTQEGSADLKMASTTISATSLVMPAANTTVTANYTTKPGGGSGSGNGSGGSGSGSGGGTTNRPTVSGNGGTTTVIIDKNGLSNTGVVSVTIKGSSDNFILKITEDPNATEAAVRALMAEYGSLDNIKYFPMDISLYDSTGNTKITDTSGLSITITLPLPDSMITYAGNNRIAGVVNDKLDKLSPKFTTIDGVSCITFTAEHFSPYVIYVDTGNLESVGVTDKSPKTGDIHPKWFIVIGLACMSVILFAKKDKNGKKVLVRA